MALNKRTLLVAIDGARLQLKTLIVPDSTQEEDMIFGRSTLKKPGVIVVMEIGEKKDGRVIKMRKKIEKDNRLY